jgi:hypothetical protein
MKTEVYSWRLSRQRKEELEVEARRTRKSLAKLLEEITHEWLRGRRTEQDAINQENLRKAARKAIGAFASGQSGRSRKARQLVREKLTRKYAR